MDHSALTDHNKGLRGSPEQDGAQACVSGVHLSYIVNVIQTGANLIP